MGFDVGYALCGLSPQIDGMPVILRIARDLNDPGLMMPGEAVAVCLLYRNHSELLFFTLNFSQSF